MRYWLWMVGITGLICYAIDTSNRVGLPRSVLGWAAVAIIAIWTYLLWRLSD